MGSLKSLATNQEFNTLDSQREYSETFIRSQGEDGWICLLDRYDDGGFSGGNMDRPALQRLMGDIEAGKVDCVVAYKIDRLSRSLLDFARMMEVFDRHNVSFVSVTQQFNTATSMGRLMQNVLLSFAQFEREMISERTRDKIAANRRQHLCLRAGDDFEYLRDVAVGTFRERKCNSRNETSRSMCLHFSPGQGTSHLRVLQPNRHGTS